MKRFARPLFTVSLLLSTLAAAQGLEDALSRNQSRGGSGCTGVGFILFLVIYRMAGVDWGRAVGCSMLPGIFGWSVWRDLGLGTGIRWFSLVFAVLQAGAFVLGLGSVLVIGALTRGASGQGGPAIEGPERLAIFHAGFLARCGRDTAPAVCECVAGKASSSRDETDLKRLGFGLQQGGLAVWLRDAKQQCAAGAPTAAPPGKTTETAPVENAKRPSADDPDDSLGLHPWCTVSSSPTGAKVFVDGGERGKTPLRTRLTAARNNTVRVELDGFFPESRTLEPNAKEATEVSVTLRPASRVRVTTEPAGAQVSIGGQVVIPQTPGISGPLEPGPADIVVTLAGYEQQQQRVTLAEQEAPLSFTLSHGAKVAVASAPPGAEVKVDDVVVGATPLDVYVSPKGKHTIVISKPTWSTVKRVLTRIKPGERVVVSLVDLDLVPARKRAMKARTIYGKAETTLAQLQAKAEATSNVTPALEKQLATAERVMEKASIELESAEVALKAVEERRASETP